MTYVPQTTLAPGVSWPKYVKRKPSDVNIWDEKPPPTALAGSSFSEISLRVIEFIAEHPWQTSYTIGKALGLPTKVVSVKTHLFAKSKRLVTRPVEGVRGKAMGFAINLSYGDEDSKK